MSQGVLGFCAVSMQNSFGTNTASWNFIPIISEGIVQTIEEKRRGNIVGRTAEGIAQRGIERNQGDITFEPHPIHIGRILRGVFGQSSSSTFTTSGGAFIDYQHVFIPRTASFDRKTMLPPYTIQVHRDVTSAFQYTDALFTKLELTIQGNALVQAKASVVARVSSIMAASTATFTEPIEWPWNVASVTIAGNAVDFVESMTISIENPVDGLVTLDGTTQVNRFVRNNPTAIRVRAKFDFQDLTEMSNFRNQVQQRLLVNLAAAVSSGPSMLIDIPNMLYNTFPAAIAGPGRISVDLEASGEFNVTSNYAIQITLTNTQVNYTT